MLNTLEEIAEHTIVNPTLSLNPNDESDAT